MDAVTAALSDELLQAVLGTEDRTAALRRADLLADAPHAAFDRLARLAATTLRAPVALLSLVDADRQVVAGCIGLPEPWTSARQTPLSHAFCQHVVATRAPLLVTDARDHPTLRDHPALPELGVVAYAGLPLITSDGVALGSFCVIDHQPRVWTDTEIATLRDLAASALTELALQAVAQRAARTAERASEERFQSTFEQAPVGLAHLAPSGRWLRVNRALCALLGVDEAALRGGDWPDLAHPDDRPALRRALDRVLGAEADPVALEARYLRPDGATVWGALSLTTVRDAAGQPRYHIAILEDITARRELERAREEFLSSAAHDLKTPLTSIRGLAQLARRRLARLTASDTAPLAAQDIAPLVEQLEGIEAATARMTRLIDTVSDLTRTRLGAALELDRAPCDLVALVGAVVARFAGQSPHRIALCAEAPTLTLALDADRLDRVVDNLLSNAVKYSPAGGDITVRVAREDGADGPAAVLTVRDQGLGIPAADLPHVFARFHRAAGVQGHIAGTGIGLASVAQIVQQHGGSVAVASQEGAGATFTVRLPLADALAPPPANRVDGGAGR